MILLDSYSMFQISKEYILGWFFFFLKMKMSHPHQAHRIFHLRVLIRLRDIKHKYQVEGIIAEHTGEPKGDIQSNENSNNLQLPDNKNPDFEPMPYHKIGENQLQMILPKKLLHFLLIYPDSQMILCVFLSICM